MPNTTKSRTPRRRSSTRRSTTSRATGSSRTRRTGTRSAARRTSTARRPSESSRSTSSRTGRASAGSKSRRSTASRGTASRSTRSTASRKSSSSASKNYSSVKRQLDQQITSLRQLKTQAEGTASQNRPSPTTITRFANVVSKGGVIRKASTAAIQRAAGKSQKINTASGALKALKSKFGATIKAVTPAKNGGWLIAASSTWKGKPFKFGQ